MTNRTLANCVIVCPIVWSLAAGCAARKPQLPGTMALSAASEGKHLSTLDAPMATQVVFTVNVSIISVPYGTLSRNEEFWKRIDEHALDPGTYDLLYRSGVRVGKAPLAERDLLDKYIDSRVTIAPFYLSGTEVKNRPIELKKDVLEQDIFHFSKFNENIGKTYFDSDNFINISFEPALRKQGQMRLTCCPMVRSKQSRQRATLMNQMYVITQETPEALYDLNFKVDLSGEEFLIAMPSPVSTTTDVGAAFFTKDGPSEKLEQVLFVQTVPHEVQMSRPPQQ